MSAPPIRRRRKPARPARKPRELEPHKFSRRVVSRDSQASGLWLKTFNRKDRTMPRVKGGPGHARKRKRILRRASGMRGMSGHNYRPALEFTRKADVYAYEHRKQ